MSIKGFRRLTAVGLSTALTLTAAGAVFANDVLRADGDTGTVGLQAVNLGSVCPGGSVTPANDNVTLWLVANSRTTANFYLNNASVSFTAIVLPASVTASPSANVTMSPTWETATSGTVSDTTSAKLGLTDAGTTTGANSANVTYQARGQGYRSLGTTPVIGAVSVNLNVQVTWTVLAATDPACGGTDPTPPTVSYVLTPSAPTGTNGWYKSNVSLVWTVTENESPATLVKTGCVDQTVTTDQAPTTYMCSATSAGGAAGPVSVTVKRDATAPTVSGSAAPAPNANGWNNTDVTVTYTCADNLSGVASCGPTQTLTSDGANHSATGNVTDEAGNTGSTTVSGINVDESAPSALAHVSAAPNGNGWNNTDVTVSFSGDDGTGSGVDSCTADTVVSEETAGQTVDGTCDDLAGNTSAKAKATVMLDKTAPQLAGAPTTTANGSGWFNTDVTVHWTCSDALSGVDGSCPADQTLSTEGMGMTTSSSVGDLAGNTTGPVDSSPAVNLDKTAPVVTVTGVTDGATYTLGSVPVAGCSTSDALSGVATDATLSSVGGPVAAVTATCSGGSDLAGNPGSASATYYVHYAWSGFRTFDNMPTCNTAKAGQPVFVKFSLVGNQGLNVVEAGFPRTVGALCGGSTTTDTTVTPTSATGGGLSYNAAADEYSYHWKTDKSWAGKSLNLQVMLNDGTLHEALFYFTR